MSLVVTLKLKHGSLFTLWKNIAENCSFVVHLRHPKSSEGSIQLQPRLESQLHST